MKKLSLRTIATLNVNRRNSIRPATVRHAFAFVSLVLACFGLSPGMQAGTSLGAGNTADGAGALQSLTTGIHNTANGVSALQKSTTGTENTALGNQALQFNTTGNNNIAVGSGAGDQLTTGNNNIVIGNPGVTAETDTIRIGIGQSATFIAGIFGAVATGSQVGVDSNGHLGVLTVSSARFKDEIKPMDKASEVILALKPVTFRYKQEFDPKGIQQFGLVAEQVERVNPALAARDEQGKPYTVRYEAVNAMLLNEFLKEHRAFLQEQRTVEELKKQVAALTAGLQKVSAQLEASKPEPRVVNNP